MIGLFALAVCGLVLLRLVLTKGRKKDLPPPPGPGIWETIYHLLISRQDVQKVSAAWADKYGDLIKVRCGLLDAVIVSGLDAGKSILGIQAGSVRYPAHNIATISGGYGYGIIHSNGKHWAEARKQGLAVLQTYGFGRKEAESIITVEADTLRDWIIKEMEKSPGGIGMLHLYEPAKLCASSTIWQMIASKRLTPESREIYDLMNEFIDAIQMSCYRGLIFFPWLKYIFPKWTAWEDCLQRSNRLHEYAGAEFDRHKETYQEGKLRDLMDSYVKHLREVKDPNSAFYGKLGRKNTVSTIVDMMVATWDSVGGSVCYALCYLAAHPEVQKKLHEEIDRVLGGETPPSGETKNSMPYMLATVDEAFRMGSIAPWGVPHKAAEDIVYNGYKINKGDMIICNTHRIHYDKRIWGDPENFRPDRFLVEGGKELKKYVVPFSIGKRSCPGAPLSTETVYIFLARILQKFEVHTDPNTPKEKYMETQMMISQTMKNYKLIFKPRA